MSVRPRGAATQPAQRLAVATSVARAPLHVVLVEPQIPPNTGNVARLCAATGCALHLVEPLGFSIDDRELKRAGLDYWAAVDLRLHASLAAFLAGWEAPLWLLTTRAARDAMIAAGYRFAERRPFGHGAESVASHPLRERAVLIASYHPSRQNTNTGLLTEAMLDAVFRRARGLVTRA